MQLFSIKLQFNSDHDCQTQGEHFLNMYVLEKS